MMWFDTELKWENALLLEARASNRAREHDMQQDFATLFETATGHRPYHYQRELASTGCEFSSRLISVPTGMGKTAAVTLAWLWNRVVLGRADWPCRLVYCLPMRTLVEQTRDEIARWLDKLVQMHPDNADLAWLSAHSPIVLMGGFDNDAARREWDIYPEKPAILIGTQDMLLSRALNRGYGMSRARWPMHFALLNNDCLWVMDETQLMDVGLATSAQLQAFRRQDHDRMKHSCFTWWMSATLQPEWIHSPETDALLPALLSSRVSVGDVDRSGPLWASTHAKSLHVHNDPMDGKALAAFIASTRSISGLTLVIVNTVKRAVAVFDALAKNKALNVGCDIHLLHSRFRPADRAPWRKTFLRRGASADRPRIIVATQVVEAGVDISADVLVTDLAPWTSIVQRFGRAARYGGKAEVHVIGVEEKQSAPYEWGELESSLTELQSLNDVSIRSLDAFEAKLSPECRKALYPYDPAFLLLREEIENLFDTSADLTGADLDVSRFIRSGEETDCQIAWLALAKGEMPPSAYHPARDELCSVPIGDARKFLEKNTAWRWDYLDRTWLPVKASALYPGIVLVVRAEAGGYSPVRGFDPAVKDAVPCITAPSCMPDADAAEEDESLSVTDQWQTISEHGVKAAKELALILGNDVSPVLDIAARWHDFGKAHPAFFSLLIEPPSPDIAKAPASAWRSPPKYAVSADDPRPGFRHELASSLAILDLLRQATPDHPALRGPWKAFFPDSSQGEQPERDLTPAHEWLAGLSANAFNLLIYLVVAHHGKVRVSLHASPADQGHPVLKSGGEMPIRGILEGDMLPATRLSIQTGVVEVPATTLTLAPAAIGVSENIGASWGDRCAALLAEHGPFQLAYLETLIRAADIRASRK